jgi:uncharacterized SAM-binding protein YcdF (DUF218 family)
MTTYFQNDGADEQRRADGPPRPWTDSLAARLLITGGAMTIAAFAVGFLVFAAAVTRDLADSPITADAIVVLTGDDFRITQGSQLLLAGRAKRMLISGVNSKTSRDDLIRLSGLEPRLFDCCVDIGHEARDTVGNATETRKWIAGRKISRLIVVTSAYHMPRSLAEMMIALPGVELIPHNVQTRSLRDRAWWLESDATKRLLMEYLKFTSVAARLTVERYVLRPLVYPVMTAAHAPPPSRT